MDSKKIMNVKVLNSEESKTFLMGSVIHPTSRDVKTTVVEKTKKEKAKKKNVNKEKVKKEKPSKTKKNSVKIPAMSMEELENYLKLEIQQVLAKQFISNRKRIEGVIKEPKQGENGRPQFLVDMSEMLKKPSPELRKVKETKEESDETKDESESVLLADMIPKLTGSYFENFDKQLMRLHRLHNIVDKKTPKMKAEDLVMTYNPKMVRESKPVIRTKAEQLKRDKNTLATRVTRMRKKYEEEQIQIKSAFYDNCTIDTRRKNACLMAYINMLLKIAGEAPVDLIKITENMLAVEFKEEQDQLNNCEGTDDSDNDSNNDNA